jgi:tetratricopeptide (TPR) repeat protein
MQLLILLASSSQYPFAQGIFTGILLLIVIFIFRIIGKGMSKAGDAILISTGDVNVLLNSASKKIKEGNIEDSIKLYNKVLELEPLNVTALISMGNISFANEDYMNAERFYQKLYDNYRDDIESNEQSIKINKEQLCLSFYKLGYIFHQQNNIAQAKKLKKLAFEHCDLTKKQASVIKKYNY